MGAKKCIELENKKFSEIKQTISALKVKNFQEKRFLEDLRKPSLILFSNMLDRQIKSSEKLDIDIYELANSVGLKRNSVYDYINELLERNLIKKSSLIDIAKGKGRPRIAFYINPYYYKQIQENWLITRK